MRRILFSLLLGVASAAIVAAPALATGASGQLGGGGSVDIGLSGGSDGTNGSLEGGGQVGVEITVDLTTDTTPPAATEPTTPPSDPETTLPGREPKPGTPPPADSQPPMTQPETPAPGSTFEGTGSFEANGEGSAMFENNGTQAGGSATGEFSGSVSGQAGFSHEAPGEEEAPDGGSLPAPAGEAALALGLSGAAAFLSRFSAPC